MDLGIPLHELKKQITDVTTRFYELIFDDRWFSQLFKGVDQDHITNQQIDFMFGAMGGPKNYAGRSPKDAHPHIWIDESIWEYRENILKSVFQEMKTDSRIQEAWLRIDNSFKNAIVNKKGPEECKGRYKTEPIIYIPKPIHLKKTG